MLVETYSERLVWLFTSGTSTKEQQKELVEAVLTAAAENIESVKKLDRAVGFDVDGEAALSELLPGSPEHEALERRLKRAEQRRDEKWRARLGKRALPAKTFC